MQALNLSLMEEQLPPARRAVVRVAAGRVRRDVLADDEGLAVVYPHVRLGDGAPLSAQALDLAADEAYPRLDLFEDFEVVERFFVFRKEFHVLPAGEVYYITRLLSGQR